MKKLSFWHLSGHLFNVCKDFKKTSFGRNFAQWELFSPIVNSYCVLLDYIFIRGVYLLYELLPERFEYRTYPCIRH